MNIHQVYYNEFCRGGWAVEDPKECLCGGSGWALSDVDTWHECPIHYKGQPHPEDFEADSAIDDVSPEALAELELHGEPVVPEYDDPDLPF